MSEDEKQIYLAWTRVKFYGSTKFSADPGKQVMASKMMLEKGWTTNEIESMRLTGTKWRNNMKVLDKEIAIFEQTMKPYLKMLAEIEAYKKTNRHGSARSQPAIPFQP